jgi:hypothetical protein
MADVNLGPRSGPSLRNPAYDTTQDKANTTTAAPKAMLNVLTMRYGPP